MTYTTPFYIIFTYIFIIIIIIKMVLRRAPTTAQVTVYREFWEFDLATQNPLSIACFYRDCRRLKQLIAKGGDVNERDVDGDTLLVLACALGYPDVVEVLLEAGADWNLASIGNRGCGLGKNPLDHLCDRTGVEGDEPLYQEHVECAELLLKYGANINCQDEKGMTPLMVAANRGNVEFTRWLLEHEADVGLQDIHGWTALKWCAFEAEEVKEGMDVRTMLLEASCRPYV